MDRTVQHQVTRRSTSSGSNSSGLTICITVRTRFYGGRLSCVYCPPARAVYLIPYMFVSRLMAPAYVLSTYIAETRTILLVLRWIATEIMNYAIAAFDRTQGLDYPRIHGCK